MKSNVIKTAIPLSGCMVVIWALCAVAGDLNPPAGPVAATMKTLQQVEPRTPIGQADVPFTIFSSGSYYLTDNLMAVGNIPAVINVNPGVDDVTLDLKGFTITGSNEVAQASDGVRVSGGQNVVIRNGTIRACISDGIDSASFGATRVVVEDIVASDNFVSGIRVGARSVVRRCLAVENGGHGIEAQDHSTVKNCSAIENTLDGIHVSGGSAVGCFASQNTGDGVEISADSVAIDNHCDGNGNGGDGAGIHATGANNRIEGNTASDNDRGIDVDASGNLVIRNCAGQNTTEYDIAAGNVAGPIVTSLNVAANDNPHANYEL